MKNIAVVIICLFLNVLLCFAKPEYSLSEYTLADIAQIKQRMDIYAQDLLDESKQHGSDRRDRLKKVINCTSIISSNLESLLSILGSEDLESLDQQTVDLTPKEVYKFIDYVIVRIDSMVIELDKLSRSTNDALMIHYTEIANRLFKEGKQLLEQVQVELNQL